MAGHTVRCTCGGEYKRRNGQYGPFWGCSNYPTCKGLIRGKEYDLMRKGGVALYTPIIKAKSDKPKADLSRSRSPRIRRNTSGVAYMPTVRMTDEQRTCRDHINDPSNRFLMVDADAGTGKTSLLKAIGAEYEDSQYDPAMLIIAYNARPIKQLNAELPSWMVASTVHGIGNDSVVAAYGVGQVNKKKTRAILEEVYGRLYDLTGIERTARRSIYNQVRDIVSLCKMMVFTHHTSDAQIIEACTKYNKPFPRTELQSLNATLDMVRCVLTQARAESVIIKHGHDYDDMLWLPLVNNLPVAKYPFVAVDERQDLSLARMLLAIEIVADDGKLMGVGDWRQAIYGFAGADTSSMETFKVELERRFGQPIMELPLTVNWRCPTKVLDIARVLKPSIKARPNAPAGNIHAIQPSMLADIARVGDVCVSRKNAPLVRAAYSLMRRRIPARILGNNIADDIAELLYDTCHDGRAGFCDPVEAVDRLNDWYGAEVDGIHNQQMRDPQAAIDEVDDRYYCCLAALRARIRDGELLGCDTPTVEQAIREIKALFIDEETEDPNASCVLFTTVHKFKGGQAKRVFVLEGGINYPLPHVKTEWEMEQEDNLLYVAVTRAGDGTDSPDQALIFVNGIPTRINAEVRQHLTPLIVNGVSYLNAEIEER